MLESVIAFVISVLAAWIYRDFRLEGEPSTFKRIIAFCLGFPWSVLVLATVEPEPDRVAGGDDGADLLEEIRRERESLDEPPPSAPPPGDR